MKQTKFDFGYQKIPSIKLMDTIIKKKIMVH